MYHRPLLILGLCLLASAVFLYQQPYASALPQPWPPKIGAQYPDISLQDHLGRRIQLSQFKGNVLLIEPIGMSCPACQGFAGGNTKGGFAGVSPQSGLISVRQMLERYAGNPSLETGELVLIQILFYDMKLQAPNMEDAKAWVSHFGLESDTNHYVLFGSKDYLHRATYDLIPGFQLVDRDFVLRYDASGHHPKHSLYSDLFPAISSLLKE